MTASRSGQGPPNRKPRAAGDRTGLRTSTDGNSDISSGSAASRQARGEDARAELRLRRNVERLHALGARPLYELLVELGRDHGIAPEITAKLSRYAACLSPEMLRVSGGDRFPPVIWAVGRSAPQ